MSGVVEALADHHAEMVQRFTCNVGEWAQELVDFLHNDAQKEQALNLSTTFLFLSSDGKEIDAFATLSTTGIPVKSDKLKARLSIGDRPFMGAVMIDYVAVSDGGRKRNGAGFGVQVWRWVRNHIFNMNAGAGVRFVGLEVRAGNWKAYQRYSSADWGFKALPMRDGQSQAACPAPDPSAEACPTQIHPKRFITMYFDLTEHYGAYWPQEP